MRKLFHYVLCQQIGYLRTIGGQDLDDTVKRMLAQVMTKGLADKHNVVGKVWKHVFQALKTQQSCNK